MKHSVEHEIDLAAIAEQMNLSVAFNVEIIDDGPEGSGEGPEGDMIIHEAYPMPTSRMLDRLAEEFRQRVRAEIERLIRDGAELGQAARDAE